MMKAIEIPIIEGSRKEWLKIIDNIIDNIVAVTKGELSIMDNPDIGYLCQKCSKHVNEDKGVIIKEVFINGYIKTAIHYNCNKTVVERENPQDNMPDMANLFCAFARYNP